MYGHIGQDGFVGELFERMPPEEQYHETYRARITELPEGVGAGWKLDGGEWVPPRKAGRAQMGERVRAERGRLLDRCDIVYCNAANWELMDGGQKAAWHIYKQRLRDIPEQEGFPYEVAWPELPGGEEPGAFPPADGEGI